MMNAAAIEGTDLIPVFGEQVSFAFVELSSYLRPGVSAGKMFY